MFKDFRIGVVRAIKLIGIDSSDKLYIRLRATLVGSLPLGLSKLY